MKIRNGFVSNSSSSSFIIDAKYKDKIEYLYSHGEDGRDIDFYEYIKDYILSESKIYEITTKLTFVSNKEYKKRFETKNIHHVLPNVCKPLFLQCMNINKDINKLASEYDYSNEKVIELIKLFNQIRQDICIKIYDVLKEYHHFKLYEFKASDHDYSPISTDMTKEEYFINEIEKINCFTRIYNEH